MQLTRTDYLLVRLANKAGSIVRFLGDVETERLRADLETIRIERPLFLTGLARSGTTILLQELAATGLFATHQYRDFPLVMAPCAWNWFVSRMGREQAPFERPHQDRIQITPRSPEAFEEPIWKHFFPFVHANNALHKLDAATRHERFERFFREHIQKMIFLRGRGQYLSKGNYNVTRIEYLAKIFPDARFVIPVRHPAQHVASLARQHDLFCGYAAQDARVPRYLACAGHYEFGPQRVAIRLNHAEANAASEAWNAGRERLGYALQWAQVYRHVDALRRVPGLADRMLIVRYEDFCRSPLRTLESILQLAGVEPPADWDDRGFGHIAAPSAGDVEDEDECRETFETTCAVAKLFGYDAAVAAGRAAAVAQACP